ncbi:MAG: hypothetical protein H7836_16785, partial [Magnetococcus sp. YQC-3]
MAEFALGGVHAVGVLLERILPDFSPTPEGAAADQALERWFRQQRTGSRERAEVGELLYHVLRHRRRLERMVRAVLPAVLVPDGRQLALAAAISLRGEGVAH